MVLNRRLKKRLLWSVLLLFIFMNPVAFFHAWRFTHFSTDQVQKTNSPEKLSTTAKIKTLLTGVKNPRPGITKNPSGAFTTVTLKGRKKLECWYINADSAEGTVAVFHGYSGEKSGMLGQAEVFRRLGYNVLLIDFMGSGGSEGNRTTLGFEEAEQVTQAFNYLLEKEEKRIILYGTSMGAVAILKALNDNQLQPSGIIIECPFGSMYKTTCARFRIMKAPVFPMAGLLVFWGGMQNGFWAFGHNPTEYAKTVLCPALLLYGEKDLNVSREEISEIYSNLKGPKTLKTYADAGHENYLLKYKKEWSFDVQSFLEDKGINKNFYVK